MFWASLELLPLDEVSKSVSQSELLDLGAIALMRTRWGAVSWGVHVFGSLLVGSNHHFQNTSERCFSLLIATGRRLLQKSSWLTWIESHSLCEYPENSNSPCCHGLHLYRFLNVLEIAASLDYSYLHPTRKSSTWDPKRPHFLQSPWPKTSIQWVGEPISRTSLRSENPWSIRQIRGAAEATCNLRKIKRCSSSDLSWFCIRLSAFCMLI